MATKIEENETNRKLFLSGISNGFPIGIGYLAVAFSLGIAARGAGMTPLQGFLSSTLNHASAGEYAGIQVIAEAAPYIEMVLAIFVANARYLLMGCALSQRFAPNSTMGHRFAVGFGITDEIFGVVIARPGYVNPYFVYGMMIIAIPMWAVGTALGISVGNILPFRVVSALSVALYAMFLAVIIPPARKDKMIAMLVVVSFACSYAASKLPGISGLSTGTRTIILTVVIAGIAAALKPVREEKNDE